MAIQTLEDGEDDDEYDSLDNGDEEEENQVEDEEEDICSLEKDVRKHTTKYARYLWTLDEHYIRPLLIYKYSYTKTRKDDDFFDKFQ